MAKAPWVLTNPSSGSGNAQVNVSSSSEHTGRLPRTSVLTFKAANVLDVTRNVNQAGKPEYVDMDDAASSPQEGKVVSINGVSNSKRLTFSLGIGDLNVALPNNYTANSVSTENGTDIVGDPGALAVYNFSISITVPANTEVDPQTRQIIVEDEAGHQDTCLLTLAAGEAYLTVTEGDIELSYTGEPVSINISSNTEWTVE